MKFLKENENTERYVDNIFSVVQLAKKDKDGINATAGCLSDEDGVLLTYNCVSEADKRISPSKRNAYAASPSGNPDFIEAINNYVLDGRVTNHYGTIGTPGGTGAISTAIRTCLKDGDTIVFPKISWGNYKVFANELNLNVLTYDVYDLNDLFNKIDEVNGKVFIIINSPCENPLGHAYSKDEWIKIMNKLNSLKSEIVLLCDIAYIDYSTHDPKSYFELFNNINDNLLVLLAFSCSKTFSYYGQRLGALIAINNDQEFLDLYMNLCARLARTTWSNLNNGAMITVTDVLNNHRQEFEDEKAKAVKLLRDRIDLFVEQANACGLELYGFNDGFFITLKMPDNKYRDEYHQRLIDNHIYTIKVNEGIRVGLCATPLKKIDGLAKKMKELM